MAEEKILDRVQKLINLAEGASTPEEREAALAKADALMFNHKIDEAMLRARAGDNEARNASNMPIHDKFLWVSRGDEFIQIHQRVASAFAGLTDVKLVFSGYDHISVFGMAPDVAYFRMLWMSSHLTFSSKLYPSWDAKLTDGENIKTLAESGMKWVQMWREAQKNGALMDVKEPPADNGKMKRLYAKACKDVGEEKMKLTHAAQNYRDSYALGFAGEIQRRVYRLEDARAGRDLGGATLVLKSDADAIENLLRETYPNLTYGTMASRKLGGGVGAGSERGAAAGRAVDLSGGAGGVGGGGAAPAGIGRGQKALQ